jgi:sigma-B regulation protein RsbU (phosphoserine phosphatase)
MEKYLDNAPCIFFIIDEKGWIKNVNETLCQTTGYQKTDLLKKNISEIVTLATRIFFQTHFFPLIQFEGHAEEIYITLRHSNETEIPILLNIKKNETLYFTGIGITINNRNKYEEGIIAAKKFAEKALLENKELQQAKIQLQQHAADLDLQLVKLQQQNENLNQLNWSLTHTLQEPLRKLSLFTSLILEQNGKLPTINALQKINGLSIHIRKLFTELQQYLQIGLENKDWRFIDIEMLLHRVAKPFMEAGHAIEFKFDKLPALKTQEEYLHQLFQQLLSNAIKFKKTDETSNLKISGTVIQANSFRVIKEKYQYFNYIKISVTDNGIGFNPKYKEQIFGIFTKLDGTSAGLGMGLAMCKKIIEQFDGFITAESEENKGTTINCFFPLSAKEVNENPETDATS